MITRTFGTLVLALTLVVAACDNPAAPTTGGLRVSVFTSGLAPDLDPNGYTVEIDSADARVVSRNASFSVVGVPAGNHVIRLSGIAANCAVAGSNPVSISVEATRDTTALQSVSFVVACAPNLGSFRVTTTTSGQDPDEDGYSLMIEGVGPRSLAINEAKVFSGLRAGQYSMRLDGVSDNCAVIGGVSRLVDIAFNAITDFPIDVHCVTSATLIVTTSTTGADLNPNRYGIEVLRKDAPTSTRFAMDLDETVRLPRLLPGEYRLTLGNLAPNCAIAQNPLVVNVPAGVETKAALAVACTPLPDITFVNDMNGNSEIFVGKSNATEFRRLTVDPRLDVNPAWSPDGTRIAFSGFRDLHFQVLVMNVDGSNVRQLTPASGQDENRGPAWSPDGSRIAFSKLKDGNSEIYVINADGSSEVRLTDNASYDADPAWSPDGSKIAFTSNRGGTPGIWVMNSDGSGAVSLTSSSFGDLQPAWSPDGKRIAFAARISPTRAAIFVVNADGSGRIQYSADNDAVADPAWSPDGRQIAFTSTSNQCGWYYYYCGTNIEIAGPGASRYFFPYGTSEPAWRPR